MNTLHIKSFVRDGCVDDSERKLAIFQYNSNEILCRFVTIDETLINGMKLMYELLHYPPYSSDLALSEVNF